MTNTHTYCVPSPPPQQGASLAATARRRRTTRASRACNHVISVCSDSSHVKSRANSGSAPCDHGVCHQPLAHGKARPMPPELAAGPGGKAMGKASLRDPAAVQLQQRALRRLEARSGDARHLFAKERPRQRSKADCVWRLLGPPGSLRSRVCSRALSHQASHEGLYGALCIVVASRGAEELLLRPGARTRKRRAAGGAPSGRGSPGRPSLGSQPRQLLGSCPCSRP